MVAIRQVYKKLSAISQTVVIKPFIKMPIPAAACPFKLSVGSVLTVTQIDPTSKEHWAVNHEMLRVQKIMDGKNTERSQTA